MHPIRYKIVTSMNQVITFTGMRRANGSGQYYQPIPQYSGTESLEQENDLMEDDLKDKVRKLKSISVDIGNEVRYQDKLLREMDDDFDRTGGFLSNTMNRVIRLGKGRHNYYILYLLVFSIVVFFVLYLVIKFR